MSAAEAKINARSKALPDARRRNLIQAQKEAEEAVAIDKERVTVDAPPKWHDGTRWAPSMHALPNRALPLSSNVSPPPQSK